MGLLNILESYTFYSLKLHKIAHKFAYKGIHVRDIVKKSKFIVIHVLFFDLKYLILQSVLEINKIFK
jgi:hypothetical protein